MRIGMAGTAGTGKTTLVDMFLRDNPEYIEPDNVKRFMAKTFSNFGINKEASVYSQSLVTGFYAYSMLAHENIINARTIVDTFAYTRYSPNISHDQATDIENLYMEKIEDMYDVIFYLPIEFEMSEDGVRISDIEYRKNIDEYISDFFLYNELPAYELNGTPEQRYEKMKMIIQSIQNTKG